MKRISLLDIICQNRFLASVEHAATGRIGLHQSSPAGCDNIAQAVVFFKQKHGYGDEPETEKGGLRA